VIVGSTLNLYEHQNCLNGKLTFHKVKKISYGKTEYNQDIFKLEIHEDSIVKAIDKNNLLSVVQVW